MCIATNFFGHQCLQYQQCDIVKRDPHSANTVKIQRYTSTELRPTNRSVRGFIEQSRVSHVVLKMLAVFGVSLIMADGILTPAQSVLGAIQGILSRDIFDFSS